ncbi:MAG: hypothetical protein M1813_009614 [Trichoglossum hirsutum]|nr:MAG: hypothetical protein M1813_009614 [Trichoglossum hirsutum]
MPIYQLGAAVNFDATQSIQAIWGNAVTVYNFFSKNSMQPAAVVYAANCSVIGGESEGWNLSLQSIAARSLNGFNLGELRLGFPGQNVMSQILETRYGSRWLGILAVASLITREYSGGKEIHRLLKAVANRVTAQYVLDMEQSEKMWMMGREIFLDSPVHHEFLTIISQCAAQCNSDLLSYAYPPDQSDFLPPVMMAAFRLWEMANTSSQANHKIWAQGAMGIAHLILYLSAVCGFHVTARLDEGEAHFGDPERLTDVVVVLDREMKGEWKTGFLMDNLSIEESVQHWLGGEPKSALWRPGRAAFAPTHPSAYVLYDKSESLDPARAANLSDLLTLKNTLRESGNGWYVSFWLTNYLHSIIRSTRLVSDKLSNQNTQTKLRDNVLSERLEAAIKLFDPGLIDKERHIPELFQKIRNDQTPDPLDDLQKCLPTGKAKILCDCAAHAHNQMICKLTRIVWDLEDFAWKLWICAHTDIRSQRVLRDIGPNRDWQVMNQLGMLPGNWGMIPSVMETKTLMNCIASRLAGRFFHIQHPKLMGLTAGGAVIGLRANEAQPILMDTGHCIYIIPGSMETPERRIKEVYQEQASSGCGRWGNSAELDQVRTPRDGFGDSRYDHVIRLHGDSAFIRTSIKFGEKTVDVDILKAIDLAASLEGFEGCLGQCATGRLTETEVEQVRVVDASNYGMLVQAVVDGQPTKALPKLDLVLAYRNMAMQRAIASHSTAGMYMLQMGQCVHCAVRAALMQGLKVLID